MNEPELIFVVLDSEIVIYAANDKHACHGHINQALDMEFEGAGKWVVREYALSAKGKR